MPAPSAVEPFRIAVPDAVLADLERRLAEARWPSPLAEAPWESGTDPSFLRELVSFWRRGYDWRREEAALNRFPQLLVRCGGQRVHCLHLEGVGPAPMPLVVTHGWPGSFVEMVKVVRPLADPGAHGGDPADAFHVVVPSLPGFAFSPHPGVPGWSVHEVADLWVELMAALGYRRFGAQGGDFGAGVATALGLRHPDRLTGIHLNYIPGSYRPHLEGAAPLTAEEEAFLSGVERWWAAEGGYAHQQATFPRTLAYALADSPLGLAAWIVEKLRSWSACGGDVERCFTREELLTHVMVYWVTGCIHGSLRLYLEGARKPLRLGPGERVAVPCGVARFPAEAPFPPRAWVERGYDLVRWRELARGGHFAAWEEPELFVEEVRAFFRPLRGRKGRALPAEVRPER